MSSSVRVGLLFGGASVEHEVSVISARGIHAALDPRRFTSVPIAVTGEGRWLAPELSARILLGNGRRVEVVREADGQARLLVDPGHGGILIADGHGTVRPLEIDVLFPIVHGWGGEDGRVQGLLDLAGVPYVGAGVLGSAVGMDKEAAKKLCEAHGLPVGPWVSLLREEYRASPPAALERIRHLGLPVFVKPANGGSSVGITRVAGPDGLPEALEQAFACDRKVVIETAIDAREVECAVLGNELPEASVPGEIVPSREFYDYAAKYVDGTSQLLIPAPVEPDTSSTVRSLAIRVFRALDLQGLARIDFFVERSTQRVLVNEANTLPGFTPISMYPKLWEASGLSYPDLLARLIALGLTRKVQSGSGPSRSEAEVRP